MRKLHSLGRIACTAAMLSLAAATGYAEPIFYDAFEDAPGTFPPTGWTSTEEGIASVTEDTLEYPNLFTSGNKLEFTATTGEMQAPFTDTPIGEGETVYYSFVMQVHNVGSMADGATSAPIALRADGGAQHEGVAGIGFGRLDGDSEDEYRLSVVGGFRGFGRDDESIRIDQTFDEGETLFIVVSYSYEGMAKFWINPDPSSFGAESEPNAHYSASAPNGRAVTTLHIIDGSRHRFEHWSFDELRFGSSWADVTPEQEPQLVKTATAPAIDGEMDEVWLSSPPRHIAALTNGVLPENAVDLSARWYGLYDADNFYLGINIKDEVLTNDAAPEAWMNDRIEVYFNMDNAQPAGNARTGDNYQYVFAWNGEALVSGDGSLDGVSWEQKDTDEGWFIEIAFPWDTLFLNTPTGVVEEGYRLGFDISVVDNDGEASYDSIVFWNSTTGGLWSNMDSAGIVGMGPDFDGNYPPTINPVSEIQVAEVGTTLEFDVSADDLNTGDTLNFSGIDLPDFVEVNKTADNTATVTVNVEEGDAGIYTFTVAVTDGVYQDQTLVYLVVRNAGEGEQAPVFGPVADIKVDPQDSVDLDLVVTDRDSFTVSIALADDAPDWASLTDNGDKTAMLTLSPEAATDPGEYTVTVKATDAGGQVGTLDVAVEVGKLVGPDNWWEHYGTPTEESVETGPFLGKIWLNQDPWIYQQESAAWLYLEGEWISFGVGAWMFSPTLVPGPVQNVFYWEGYVLTSGWAWTPLGWLYPEENYAYSDAFGTWFYFQELTADGSWIYVFDFNDITPPSEPVRVEAVPVTDTRIDVTWRAATDNIGVAGYDVYRDGVYVGSVEKGMTFNDTFLAPETTYSYTVQAYDAAGYISKASGEAQATTHESRAEVDASWREAWDSWDEATIEAWYANNTGPGAIGIEEDEMWNPTSEGIAITQAWLEENEGNGNVYQEDGRWVVEGVKAGWFVIQAHPLTLRGCLALLPSSEPTDGIARPESQQRTGGPTVIIEYCWVRSAEGVTPQVRGIEGSNLIVRNCQVGPGQDAGSGFRMWNNSHLEYSWVHGLTGHHSGIALRGSNIVARRNYTEIGTSASLFIYAHDSGPPPDGLNNILVLENYINSPVSYYGMNPGGARNDLAQSATNVRVIMNRWGEKNFWPDDSHEIGGSHRTWLGDIPAGDWVDSRGNIWGGNHWIATGNYIKPQIGQYAWDHPDHVYDDPWVEAQQPTPPESEIEASWQVAWGSNDQAVIDAWYEENTGPAAIGVDVSQMSPVGDVVINEDWLLANAGPHVFQENGRWVVQAIRASSIEIDVDDLILRASLIEMDATSTTFGIEGDGDGVMIEYCEITNINENNPQSSKGIAEIDNFTVRHTEVHGLQFTAIRLQDNSTGKYNYVHSGVEGIKHVSIAIRGNDTHAYRNNLQTNSGSATLGIYSHDVLAPPTGFDNVLVEENLINGKGGHYAMMAGGDWNSQTQQATNIVVINNKFGVKYNASSGWTGSNYLWLGRAEAGECVDDRGNTWYGNTWLTTGNYVEPMSGNGVDAPSDVYNDPCADQ